MNVIQDLMKRLLPAPETKSKSKKKKGSKK